MIKKALTNIRIDILSLLDMVCYDLHFCTSGRAQEYLIRLYDELQFFRYIHGKSCMTVKEYIALIEGCPEYFTDV